LSYPVGQKELAQLVGELIDQPPERIVVGNGAASGHISRQSESPSPFT
jgi:threonine-phosphate decarboxylase